MSGIVTGKKGAPNVDMTPMVDLGFLLITFFMLTTTFNKPQAMEVNMPDKNKEEKKEDETKVKASNSLTLILVKDDKIVYYQGEPKATGMEISETNYKGSGLRSLLLTKKKEIEANKGRMFVLIKPIDKSKYINMVDVLDEMAICKIPTYAIVDVLPVEVDLVKKQGYPVE